MFTRRTVVTVATGLALAAAAPASAAPADGYAGQRSLDGGGFVAKQDLRSPDAVDAARTGAPGGSQDLRAPDTRDLATGYSPAVPAFESSLDESAGFDWTSAGIGAATGGVLILALIAAVGAVSHRLPARRRAVLPH